MLRYTLRRLLWSIPTLLATSLVLFLVTTLAPDPVTLAPEAVENAQDAAERARLEELRRSQFFDLPRFLNPNPKDVAAYAREALTRIAGDDPRQQEDGARELVRLGGAALPYVLPSLDALSPEVRGRAAVALGPVAARMGLTGRAGLDQPETATLFWTRFWDDRALDFTRPAVARAVARLIEHGSALRESDLMALDTFALPELLHAITVDARDAPDTLERVTRIAQHATQEGPVIPHDRPPAEVHRAVAAWQEWWFVHAYDFMPLDGADRALAVVTETRYGKWLRRAGSGELGLSAIDGAPIADKLRARAPVTLLLCTLAMLLSWAVAIPVGALGAWRRGRPFDIASSAIMFVLYALPTFALAELLRRIGGSFGFARITLAVVALAAGSLATCSRWQRSAMLETMRQDFVRTAFAKGLSSRRVMLVHALRNALLPSVTLAGLHLPALLGGAFMVEEVFGLPGLGYETLRAIEAHDAAWLMVVVLVAAVAITMGLVASDIAYGALDPHVREELARRQGGAA
ncbi:MAG TPA: ABC transporter permease [Polyangiaceae bacterium]|jgi:ABC-type dipeptide/oligopeptide/nickel transport system permease component|nr:ABC transporter permease [Polyangiaceae bacterium]